MTSTPSPTRADRRDQSRRTSRTRRTRSLLITALCLALLAPLLMVGPAGATAAVAETDGSSAVPTTVDRSDAPMRRLRAMLRCRGAQPDGTPSVKCTWRARTAGAAGFVLVRVAGAEREVVYRSDDLDVRSFTDLSVEFDTRYRYRLVLVDSDGDRIGRSRINRAIVKSNRPEIVDLDCNGTESDPVAVSCSWVQPSSEAAVSVQLWRLLPGKTRELVTTQAPDDTTAQDELPAGVTRARYAVIARDGDGVVVARSRAVRLA